VGGTPDSLQGLSGAPPDSQAGPQDRGPTVRTQRPDDVAAHRTLSGAPIASSFFPTATFWLVAINTTPTGHFKGGAQATFQVI
jgi:hypothetical protein